MKAIKQLLAITGSALIIVSCQNNSEQQKIESEPDSRTTEQPADNNNVRTSNKYVDLRTGEPVDLYYDDERDMTYSAVTNEPVDYYINVTTGDTVYGQGRYVVNDYLIKSTDGSYKLDEGKLKVTKDGIKIKNGDAKLKIEDGDMKMKEGDSKYKSDNDEEKMKTDSHKMKTDDGETKSKY
jgi:hypothetical protein